MAEKGFGIVMLKSDLAERPLAKFKAKGGELLWLALTNIVTAFVAWMLVKKP